MLTLQGYESKSVLFARFASGKNVLHLGAVGDTDADTEHRVLKARTGVHAQLTAVAGRCVGIDYDQPAVALLTERGIFDNLICADVTQLRRADVPLDSIDVIVVGDTIEHLSNPGALLSVLRELVDDGTSVVLTTPNVLSLPMFIRYTLGKQIEGADHVVSFNLYSLRNLLTRHDWVMDQAWGCHQAHAQERGGVVFRLGKFAFRRFPRWSGTLLVVIRPAT